MRTVPQSAPQSGPPNTASVTIPSDIAPAKPKNLTVVDTTKDLITVRWAKSEATDISGYTINLYKDSEKVRTQDITKNFSFYSFFDLENGSVYKVELIAKNDKGKTSAPAVTFGSTDFPEVIQMVFDSAMAVAVIAILLLTLLLAIRTIPHKKK